MGETMKFFSLTLETRKLSITAFSRYFVDAKVPKNSKTSYKMSERMVLFGRAENFMLAIYLFTLFTHSTFKFLHKLHKRASP